MAPRSARLVLVAPFPAGVTLDARDLLSRHWIERQRHLAAQLEQCASSAEGPCGWRAPRKDHFYEFDEGLVEELNPEVPQAFVECAGDELLDHVVSRHPEIAELKQLIEGTDALEVSLLGVRAEIADFGVGVVSLHYRVRLAPDPDLETYRDQVDDVVNQIPDLLDDLSAELARPLGEYFERPDSRREYALIKDPEVDHEPRGPRRQLEKPKTRPMWGHAIHVVEVEDEADLDAVEAEWECVLRATHQDECVPARIPGVVFRPSLGTSLVIHAPEQEVEARVIDRVLALQTLYYVGAASFDRLLFRQLNELALDTREGRVGELMRGSEEIRELYERVELFGSIVANMNLHLARSTAWQIRVWRCLASLWLLDQRLDSIDRKLEALQRLYSRVIDKWVAKRNGTLTAVALLFTVIATVSTAVDVFEFTQAEPVRSPDELRFWTVVAVISVVVAVGCLLWLYARGPPRRGKL